MSGVWVQKLLNYLVWTNTEIILDWESRKVSGETISFYDSVNRRQKTLSLMPTDETIKHVM